MAVETGVALDWGTLGVPAIYSNKVQVLFSENIVRISFGEGIAGDNIAYRTAIVMTLQDARELAGAILATGEAHEASRKSGE